MIIILHDRIFDWEHRCFICGKKLTVYSMGTTQVWKDKIWSQFEYIPERPKFHMYTEDCNRPMEEKGYTKLIKQISDVTGLILK